MTGTPPPWPPPLPLCRIAASVTPCICQCSVCCAAWASSCVWRPPLLWSGPASKWPRSSTTTCSPRSSWPPWGTTLSLSACVLRLCLMMCEAWSRCVFSDTVCPPDHLREEALLKAPFFSPHYSKHYLLSLTQTLRDITYKKTLTCTEHTCMYCIHTYWIKFVYTDQT